MLGDEPGDGELEMCVVRLACAVPLLTAPVDAHQCLAVLPTSALSEAFAVPSQHR